MPRPPAGDTEASRTEAPPETLLRLLPAAHGQTSLPEPPGEALPRLPTGHKKTSLPEAIPETMPWPLASHEETLLQATLDSKNLATAADVMEKIKLMQQHYEQSSKAIKNLITGHEKSMLHAFQTLAIDIAGGLPIKIGDAESEAVLQSEHSSASIAPIQKNTQSLMVIVADPPSNDQFCDMEHSLEMHQHAQNPLLRKIVKDALKDRSSVSPMALHGWAWLRFRARDVVERSAFEYLAAFVIALNTILIGVETEFSITHAENEMSFFDWVETVFLFLYTVEVSIKLLGFGFGECFSDLWFRFDVFIICVGLVGKVVTSIGDSEVLASWCKQLLLVRICRLVRLVRALRMFRIFKQMWSLVYGLISSMSTMLSALGLLLLATFLYACLGVDLITKDSDLAADDDTAGIVASNFSTVMQTMLTLVQFVTMDSIAAFYMPLVARKPLLALYFMSAVLLISISLMNLITAALVEGALANAASEKVGEDLQTKQKLKSILPTMLKVFQQMDKDGSGELTIEEMQSVKVDDLPKEFVDKVSIENMQDLFEVLDTDGTGRLSQNEFIEGLMNIALMEVSLPTIQILKHVRTTEDLVRSLAAELSRLQTNVQSVKGFLLNE